MLKGLKPKDCVSCGLKCFPWSKGLCRLCFLRGMEPVIFKRKPIRKISKKGEEKKLKKKDLTKLMRKEFWRFYDEHPSKRCYECSKYVAKDNFGPINVHHVLPKSRYEEYLLEHWNFALVCPECHAQCEVALFKTPKLEMLTKELKERYG